MFKTKFALILSGALCLGALAALSARAAESAPGKAGYPPPVQPASDEAETVIKRFRIPKGFKVELAAAEPLVANPVAFSIDEQGRFYVVETFRLHSGVTDIRGHMDWLDEELAVRTVEERVAYMTKHEGRRIADYTKYSDRVRLVWDSDGDGRADKASVFTDGYNGIADGLAAGVLARRGDVYFANIPNLWLLRDTNNDGKADVKKSLANGFGIRVGFLGHDLHGLRFGPDGRIYFSIGDRGAHVTNKEGRLIENREMGAVYRCGPDGSNLEIFASGLRNPQELVFDEFGNLWTGDNNSDGGDPARWVYVVENGDSGWRVGYQFINQPNSRGVWLSERHCYPQFEGQAAFLLPPLANIGNGPSGLTYHPGTGLNDSYKGHFFLCDFRGGTGSGIHSFGVKPRGAGFEVIDRTEFLWDMLVTDCDFGYDGCLYVSDWVNGWNQTGKGRIYRVFDPEKRSDPVVLETKKMIQEGFTQRRVEQLAALLEFPDQRVRQEAQFALVEKGAVNTFVQVLRDAEKGGWRGALPVPFHAETRLARLHAVWGLGQLARARAARGNDNALVKELLPWLSDTDSEVRSQTAKVFGDIPAGAAYDGLIKLLADTEARPRFFAAIALSKLGRKQAVPALLDMVRANDDKDVYLRHAGVVGLAALSDAAVLKALSSDPSAAVRLAAVVALRRQEAGEVGAFLTDNDPKVVLEAARAVDDLPIASALPKLAALIGDVEVLARQQFASQQLRQKAATAKNPKEPKPDGEPDVLFTPLLRRIVNAHFRLGRPENAAALAAFAATEVGPAAVRAEAIGVLGDWAQPSGRDNVTGLWRPLGKRDVAVAKRAVQEKLEPLLQNPSVPVELASLKVAIKLGIAEAGTTAYTLVSDGQRSGKIRLEALRALATFKSARLNDAVKLALTDKDESLRTEATKIQAQLKPSDATGRLRTTLERGGTREKQAAFATLAGMPGSAPDEILSQWLDRLNAKQVPAELQLDLIEAAGKRPAREVKDRLTRFERDRPPDDDLRAYRECLAGGNAEEGRRIFIERQDVFCVRCHKVNGEGGEAGPDLTGVASRHPREYILESIVYPNKQIAAGFESLLLTMKNGTVYAGIFKGETETEVEINSPEDGLLKLKKADIKLRERGPSAMPEELRQVLGKRDLRDLVEFLGSLK